MGAHKHRRHHNKHDHDEPKTSGENFNPNLNISENNKGLKMISNPEEAELKEQENENFEVPVEVVRALNGAEGPVSSVLYYGVKTYENAKQRVMTMENKRVKSTVGSALDLFEGTVSKATQLSPLKVERVVGALDSGVDSAVQYGKETKESVDATVAAVSARPIRLKNSTLKTIHFQLGKLKEAQSSAGATSMEIAREETDNKNEQGIGFREIFGDVQEITNSRAQKFLDASETMVDKYLEKDPEEEIENQKEGQNEKDVTTRAFQLSKVVSKRMQKRAFSVLESVKRRTEDVVHVDLMEYSKMLESAKDYTKSTYEHRVTEPLHKVKAEAGIKAHEAKGLAEKYAKIGYDKIVHVRVPYTDKDMLYYLTAMKQRVNTRIVKPCEEVVEAFKKDLEVEKMKQDPDKSLTIEAGFRALLAAARYRTAIILTNAKSYVFE